jgi:DNA-binding response OmpR family regulator
MTILIADDIEANRRLVRASIKSEGYDLVEATNGQEALEFLRTATTPIVGVIDWEMPEIDGVEVCRQARLKLDGPPLYLILLTIRSDQKDVVNGLQKGANDYVTKPFDYSELLARVKIGVQMVELQQKLMQQAEQLREAMKQIKVLSGFLPICSYCNKIRDEDNTWERVETYVSKHSEASFSHGICPECYQKEMAPMLAELKARNESAAPE